jgi:hypothetical protein
MENILSEEFEEFSSNDPLVELKSGIYNLTVNLLNNYVVYLGPEKAILAVCDFLDHISSEFKSSIQDTEQ